MILLLIYLFIAIAFSFLCSMLEAVLLSVPRSHVAVLVESGGAAGQRLQRMKEDIDRPLAAILTLNTFAHTLGAAGVGAQAAILWGDASVGIVSFVLTLLILIVSEIIPKTLGAVHARALAPFASWITHFLILILKPIVAVANWISGLLTDADKPRARISREEVRIIARMAADEGAVEQDEAGVIRNLMALREITVEEVMTPRTVVFTLRTGQTIEEVTGGEPPMFARIPVLGSFPDDVRGVVFRHQLFRALGEGRGAAKVEEFMRPVHLVSEGAKLSAVLREFIDRREHLFCVGDEFGGYVGIVTLEDVIETLLGVEIVDETDSVEDMRAMARDLARRRREERH
jgi:CBS domain containing-hemolysin-like protein